MYTCASLFHSLWQCVCVCLAISWFHYWRWLYLSIVELAVHVDLAFCNVASQVGNGMSDVIIRHGQDWDLGDGAIATFHTTCSLQ